MWMNVKYVQAPWRPESIQSPGAAVRSSCESLGVDVRDLIVLLWLEEQQVLSVT